MRTAQGASKVVLRRAHGLAGIAWLLGLAVSILFLTWLLSVPEGSDGMSIEEMSPTAVWAAVSLLVVDIVLGVVAAAFPNAGPRVVGGAVALVVVLGGVGLAPVEPQTRMLLAFLVPAVAAALVLPVALVARRGLRRGGWLMAGLALACGLSVVGSSSQQLWVSYVAGLGVAMTGILGVLYLNAAAPSPRRSPTSPSRPKSPPATPWATTA